MVSFNLRTYPTRQLFERRLEIAFMVLKQNQQVCSLNPVTYRQFALGSNPKTKLNSMVGVRERTIPTERPPLVGEVIANFCG
jgi:hypothetical protein